MNPETTAIIKSPRPRTRYASPVADHFIDLLKQLIQVDDCLVYTGPKTSRDFHYYAKRAGFRVHTQKAKDGTVRVWRKFEYRGG